MNALYQADFARGRRCSWGSLCGVVESGATGGTGGSNPNSGVATARCGRFFLRSGSKKNSTLLSAPRWGARTVGSACFLPHIIEAFVMKGLKKGLLEMGNVFSRGTLQNNPRSFQNTFYTENMDHEYVRHMLQSTINGPPHRFESQFAAAASAAGSKLWPKQLLYLIKFQHFTWW